MIGTGTTGKQKYVANYSMPSNNNILYTFNNSQERDIKLKQLKQQKLLSYQCKWRCRTLCIYPLFRSKYKNTQLT